MNALSFLDLDGCRSLRRALASIWRMRSRVTAKLCPTSSSVCSEPSSRPKRILITFSSRGVSERRTCPVWSFRFTLITSSAGDTPARSSTKSPRCESSSSPIGEEEDSHLGDFVEDREAVSPSDAASLTMLHSEVEDVLDTLTPRERRVLQLRFGLIDGHQRTLEEGGKRFGVTRERTRQIEAKALRKLRHPSRSKKLRDYLE